MLWLLLVLLTVTLTNAGVDYTTTYTGQLTFYGAGADSGGHCSTQNPRVALSNSLPTVAIGSYGNGEKCGCCVLITPKGTGSGNSDFPTRAPFTAFVNNECPECGDNNLDLAQAGDGRWDITWKYVECPASGNIDLQLKTGSSVYWTELQARNYKTALKSIEYYQNGQYVQLTRKDYNYWQYTIQVTFPVKVRLTSINGEQKETTLNSYPANEPNVWSTGFQFSGSGSSPSSGPPPTTPTKPPTTPVAPPTTPTKPPTTPPTTPTKPPTTPPTTPTKTATCSYPDAGDNNWWVEFNCDQKPTDGVTVICTDGKSYKCTLASWGTYQCAINGNTECKKPRRASVSGKCCALDSGSCGASVVEDENTNSGSQNIILPIGAIIGIAVAIVVILVVLVVIVAMKLRTPVMEHV